MAVTCDRVASAQRLVDLDAYMAEHVLGSGGFCCSTAIACRESATTRRVPVDFAEGQLSHLGEYYELNEDGIDLRILVIAMETGRLDSEVTLEVRRQQVLKRAAELPRDRNPHMVGVTHALRALHGRPIGDDLDGETLDFDSIDGAIHLFDTYAMANVRLCSSVKKDSTQSRPTAFMTRNCVGHLRETIRILQPTICVVQGKAIPDLAEVTIAGVDTLMAEFSHPAAHGDMNWGRWTNMPYLQNVVVPTLQQARIRLGLAAVRN